MAPRKKPKVNLVDHEPSESNKNTQQENKAKEDMEDTVSFGAKDNGPLANKRGRTHMHCLFPDRRDGVRQEVTFNKFG